MSSHREAPEISQDPVADSTDVYAFVSPDDPNTVTLIANYVPFQAPDGGPNFYQFGDNVLYHINIDNNGDGKAEIIYEFSFSTVVQNPNTFLYNTGPIQSLNDKNWNRRQVYSLNRQDRRGNQRQTTPLATNLACPPCNIGPLSTPNYADLAGQAVHSLPGGEKVFAGQRAEGFYVDLGAIFDLADLRPLEQLHNQFGLSVPELSKPAPGVNSGKGVNVYSIALQLPKTQLTTNGSSPTSAGDPGSVIGVWTTASRQKVSMLGQNNGQNVTAGPFVQVSRLGNPLVNEVIIPMGKKDYWNNQAPVDDSQFVQYFQHPELSALLPSLYPNAFPNLAAFNASGSPRADIVAIFYTGIPSGVVSGFQNSAGTKQADLLRLNMAIPPTTTNPSNLGVVGNDPAGFPNGRRVFDDVVAIELRALAGATLPLVNKSYTPDAAVAQVTDGLTSGPSDTSALGTENYLPGFPYLGLPYSGFAVPSS
ncbi:MAG TPA: DUF4331 domain-containing protein [Acidimicrobiales bacterium]|nr:DUF4331 domain-containing protein [Acidimicrobiales bacterium]